MKTVILISRGGHINSTVLYNKRKIVPNGFGGESTKEGGSFLVNATIIFLERFVQKAERSTRCVFFIFIIL